MRIAIHGRDTRSASSGFMEKLIELLREKGVKVLVSDKLLDHLPKRDAKKFGLKAFSHKDTLTNVDFFLSVGGDGTLLESVTYVGKSGVPILGINTGRMGFLATTHRNDVNQAIDDLLEGNFEIDERSLLRLSSNEDLFDHMPFALNDLTIMKKDSSSMITVHVHVDGELLNSYWADGIIVATPTGSTGYSLSCGGPLVYPKSDSFVITPVSPHNLTARPIVISDNSEIMFSIEGRSKKFLISLDSRYETVDEKTQLKVRKEKFKIKLVLLPGYHYFKTLRQKLNWGLDVRN
ncbi:MAG TPA: NAD kinase [Cyclobacteriaceae bacterium]|nr:NAD kinase [Cyclobacteriaceae bacterium]